MVRPLTSAATSHGEPEGVELVRVITRLEFHVAEERAIAAQAAVEAELVRQGHEGELATDGHR